jgi:hypothetical protein
MAILAAADGVLHYCGELIGHPGVFWLYCTILNLILYILFEFIYFDLFILNHIFTIFEILIPTNQTNKFKYNWIY